MASRGGASTTIETAPSTDSDQILAAVVAALGKSSSKVIDYNSENDSSVEEEAETPKSSKTHHHQHHLFSCFSNAAVKTVKPPAQTNKFSNWPKSPSHIMSRLLLSPDMSPDRILIKSVASSPGGDQSPARSRFGSFNRAQYFSGPLLSMNNRKKNKSKKKDEPSTFQNEREEPTSPKVTCMGTVKAPKKKASKPERGFCGNTKPPKWKSFPQQQVPHSGVLDLSRFGDKSGELRLRSGELKRQPSRPMHHHQQQQQQQQQQITGAPDQALKSHARKRSNSMRVLMSKDSEFDAAVASGGNISDQGSKIVMACRSSSLKKPEEVCLWRRRCTAEPMRLHVVGRT